MTEKSDSDSCVSEQQQRRLRLDPVSSQSRIAQRARTRSQHHGAAVSARVSWQDRNQGAAPPVTVAPVPWWSANWWASACAIAPSCLTFVSALHGKQLISVEDLRTRAGCTASSRRWSTATARSAASVPRIRHEPVRPCRRTPARSMNTIRTRPTKPWPATSAAAPADPRSRRTGLLCQAAGPVRCPRSRDHRSAQGHRPA